MSCCFIVQLLASFSLLLKLLKRWSNRHYGPDVSCELQELRLWMGRLLWESATHSDKLDHSVWIVAELAATFKMRLQPLLKVRCLHLPQRHTQPTLLRIMSLKCLWNVSAIQCQPFPFYQSWTDKLWRCLKIICQSVFPTCTIIINCGCQFFFGSSK